MHLFKDRSFRSLQLLLVLCPSGEPLKVLKPLKKASFLRVHVCSTKFKLLIIIGLLILSNIKKSSFRCSQMGSLDK